MKYLGLTVRLAVLLLLFGLLVYRSNCAEAAGPKKPETPYVGFYNPHVYQLGRAINAQLIHPEKGKTWLNVIWAPSYAPLLYTESLNFCGQDAVKLFDGIKLGEEIVIVYSRAVEFSKVDGMPKGTVNCRSLDFVRKMEKEQQ